MKMKILKRDFISLDVRDARDARYSSYVNSQDTLGIKLEPQ